MATRARPNAGKRAGEAVGNRTWVVTKEDPATLGALLEKRLPGSEACLSDGRVFVNRKRSQRGDVSLKPGDAVQVFAPRQNTDTRVEILEHQRHWLAALKPPSLPSVPDQRGIEQSLQNQLAGQLGLPLKAIRMVSRLDVGVGGVVVVALSHRGEQALNEARAEGRFRKFYVGLSAEAPPNTPLAQSWTDPIGGGGRRGKQRVNGQSAKACHTRVEQLSSGPKHTLLGMEAVTGRTHQLRVHCAHHGLPLLGDGLYGGAKRVSLGGGKILRPKQIGLHARWVELVLGGKRAQLEAPLPAEWVNWAKQLDEDEQVWNTLPYEE